MRKTRLRYFSPEEMTHSGYAQRHGMANEPTSQEQWDALQALGEAVLDPARERLGAPITINSGYRSVAVNRAIGGAHGSQHTKGEAVDVTCANNARLLEVLRGLPYDQLITYIDKRGAIRWIHVSYRATGNRGQTLTKRV